jgi:hypothetical protein
MKGENDDLILSLAIGTWLYDASSDYSKDSDKLNQAMLSAMGIKSKQFNGASNDVLSNKHQQETNRDRVLRGYSRPMGIPPEFAWVYKN